MVVISSVLVCACPSTVPSPMKDDVDALYVNIQTETS